MNSSKVKTLMIYQLLKKYSDEEHPITTPELIRMLEEKGIKGERKSIYSDIKALIESGIDIVTVSNGRRGYFIAERQFEVPEIMLLISAVTSAGFITPKKTKKLIDKLRSLSSVYQAESMTSRFYVEEAANKCDNEQIYIIINSLHNAIIARKKIKFVYKRRSIDVENKKKNTEKTFVVSPYALLWKNDHYYLVCNNEKYDNLMNLRVDRIKKLEQLDADWRPFGEVSEYKYTFDIQDYSSKMFNMFSGDVTKITLRCHISLQEEMLDRFGSSIPLKAVDGNHFETTVDAALSDGLASWIMQYGGKLKVVEPPQLVDMVKSKAEDILITYED